MTTFKIKVTLGKPKYAPISVTDPDETIEYWIELKSPTLLYKNCKNVYKIVDDNFTSENAPCIGAVKWSGPEILYNGCSQDGDTNYDVWEIFKIASVLNVFEMMKINFLTNTIEIQAFGEGAINEIQDAFANMIICAYDSRDV